MNKNQYARAITAITPSPFPKTIPIGGIDLPYTAGIRRKVRKLVQSGKVNREELPLTHNVNNATFNWLKPLTANDIRANYTGEPFNVGAFAPSAPAAPVIAATIEKVDTITENTAVRKVAKRKTAPKVEATVTKVSKVEKPAKVTKPKAEKTTKPKATKAKAV